MMVWRRIEVRAWYVTCCVGRLVHVCIVVTLGVPFPLHILFEGYNTTADEAE